MKAHQVTKLDNPKPNLMLMVGIPSIFAVVGVISIFGHIDKPDQRIGAIIALATFLVTYIYVVLTYGILKANSRMVQEQIKNSAEQSRPFVVVSFPSVDAAVYIKIENVGNRPATDVQIQFEPDIAELKQKVAAGPNHELTFSDQILQQPFLAPSAVISTIFGNSERIIELPSNEQSFKAIVTYKDLESQEADIHDADSQSYRHVYTINLAAYIHEKKIRFYTVDYRLKHIDEHLANLKDISGYLRGIKSSIDDLVPPPTHYEDGTPIEE